MTTKHSAQKESKIASILEKLNNLNDNELNEIYTELSAKKGVKLGKNKILNKTKINRIKKYLEFFTETVTSSIEKKVSEYLAGQNKDEINNDSDDSYIDTDTYPNTNTEKAILSLPKQQNIPLEITPSNNETYKHKLAKELMVKWIYDEPNELIECLINNTKKYVDCQSRGIYIDYPIVRCKEFDSLANMWGECYEYEGKVTEPIYGVCFSSPTIKWCEKEQMHPLCIFDIAIAWKGITDCCIEIIEDDIIDDQKMTKIQEACSETNFRTIIGIRADWILAQTKKPNQYVIERYISMYDNEDIKRNDEDINIIKCCKPKRVNKLNKHKICKHDNCKEVLMETGFKHYAKSICLDCNKFIKWVKNPKNIQIRLNRQIQIDKIKTMDELSEWERAFCENMYESHYLTEKQTECLKRIMVKYGCYDKHAIQEYNAVCPK